MNPENPQFDEVAARRVKKEHDNGEHEFYGPALLNAPQEHKDAMMAKINSCPHCKAENAAEDSTEAPMATVTQLPGPTVGTQVKAAAKDLGHVAMHMIGDHGGYGKSRDTRLSNPECSICNGSFWD